MVGLITIGLALDRDLLHLKTTFPSLDPFIWDLAKGVTLGTITIAILDDVRSWGLSWRILRANLTSLNEVVARLNNILYNHIGLNWRAKAVASGLKYTTEDVYELSSWAFAIYSAHQKYLSSEFSDSPLAESPIKDWDTFTSVMRTENMSPPDRASAEKPFSVEGFATDLTTIIEELREMLETVRPGAASVTSSNIGDLLRQLQGFPDATKGLVQHIHQLASGSGPQEKEEYRQIANQARLVYSTMLQLKLVLDGLLYEASTGRPAPVVSDYI
jgi:hypothetical protein